MLHILHSWSAAVVNIVGVIGKDCCPNRFVSHVWDKRILFYVDDNWSLLQVKPVQVENQRSCFTSGLVPGGAAGLI